MRRDKRMRNQQLEDDQQQQQCSDASPDCIDAQSDSDLLALKTAPALPAKPAPAQVPSASPLARQDVTAAMVCARSTATQAARPSGLWRSSGACMALGARP